MSGVATFRPPNRGPIPLVPLVAGEHRPHEVLAVREARDQHSGDRASTNTKVLRGKVGRRRQLYAKLSAIRASNHFPISLKFSLDQPTDAAKDFWTGTIVLAVGSYWKTAFSHPAAVLVMVE